MTYQRRAEMLSDSLKKMLKKGDKESVLQFLKEVSSLLPPSDDFGISLAKKGVHEYILDRRGVAIISLSEDEYLPYFSANEKRIKLEDIPEDILLKVKDNWKEILDQLRDYLLDYGKIDKRYIKLADEVNSVIFENL